MLIEVLASWVPDEGKFTVYERILGSTAEDLVSCYHWWRGYTRFSAIGGSWGW